MKNLNKMTDFDKQWKEVFDDAEMAPSEDVWNKIDSALSKEEVGYFKQRALIFKLLAAASIIFALGVSIFSINYYLDQNSGQQANQGSEEMKYSHEPDETLSISGTIKDESESSDSKSEIENENGSGNQGFLLSENTNEELKVEESSWDKVSVISEISPSNLSSEDVREYFHFSALAAKDIYTNPEGEMLHKIDHIYLIPIMPRGASRQKNEKQNGGFLAGLDFSTGVFDPNFQQGNNVFASAAGSTFADARVESVNNQLASFNTSNKDFLLVRSAGQETKPEIAYSYGANFGFRVSKRFVVQTGIAYRKANTTTTTTGYIEGASNNSHIPIVASYQYQLEGLSSVKRIPETNLSNQYEFASIPIRAGYVFLDRKVNLTLMAGVSSEFFLNNQISSNNNDFETLTSSSGEGSPYKSVYFNGSLGTMLGYTFAKNYLITVEPSYRFAVNSFTRNDFYLNSYPSSFMVSFGVAYNFR